MLRLPKAALDRGRFACRRRRPAARTSPAGADGPYRLPAGPPRRPDQRLSRPHTACRTRRLRSAYPPAGPPRPSRGRSAHRGGGPAPVGRGGGSTGRNHLTVARPGAGGPTDHTPAHRNY
ncbi:hypothetical protein GCM10010309_46080 [Streptomyces violaceochromogenes]|nr:hypothetical protein GCM10010309_46080 [Streptomyces violaceochromogenes]